MMSQNSAVPRSAASQLAIDVVVGVADLIRTANNGDGMPSGECYALLQSAGVSLNTYNSIIDKLVEAKVISNKGHWLKWIKN